MPKDKPIVVEESASGLSINEADGVVHVSLRPVPEDGPLSDDELENVAAGIFLVPPNP